MSLDFTDDQSTLVQVMAWCCQATSHYLSQCWPRSLSPYGVTRPQWVNSLWPSNTIWRHRSGSTLAEIMACCLTAPSHYLNQCWCLINEVVWHSSESSFRAIAQAVILYNEFENHTFEISAISPKGEGLTHSGAELIENLSRVSSNNMSTWCWWFTVNWFRVSNLQSYVNFGFGWGLGMDV